MIWIWKTFSDLIRIWRNIFWQDSDPTNYFLPTKVSNFTIFHKKDLSWQKSFDNKACGGYIAKTFLSFKSVTAGSNANWILFVWIRVLNTAWVLVNRMRFLRKKINRDARIKDKYNIMYVEYRRKLEESIILYYSSRQTH